MYFVSLVINTKSYKKIIYQLKNSYVDPSQSITDSSNRISLIALNGFAPMIYKLCMKGDCGVATDQTQESDSDINTVFGISVIKLSNSMGGKKISVVEV